MRKSLREETSLEILKVCFSRKQKFGTAKTKLGKLKKSSLNKKRLSKILVSRFPLVNYFGILIVIVDFCVKIFIDFFNDFTF